MTNAYDDVAYPSGVYAYTHPDDLATIAILSGMKPAPVERCRVLELGCGDGCNLISMAYGLPESQFLGLDLAAEPIARGAAMIDALGLGNVSLQVRDVATVGPGIGEFDYIIAHGLYSWVPAPVRGKIMELCGRHLSPNGVAYVSYNTYPGNHVRDITRHMIRYHAGRFANPGQQIHQARGLLKMAAEAGHPNELYRQILIQEQNRIGAQADDYLFHDDLSPFNQPFYFHEFMDEAHRHRLQFLGEAEIVEKQERDYPPHILDALAQLDPDDVVAGEQYRDFLRGRAFRRTLLCRQGIPLDRSLDSAHMSGLFLAGNIRPAAAAADLDGVEVFCGPNDSEFETDQPLVKAALRRIGAASPAFLPFSGLLAQARQDTGRTEDLQADVSDLAGAMLQLAIAGGLELRAHQPRFVVEPGPYPTASALARLQAESSHRVSTMLHQVVAVDSTSSRLFLRLLDGSRDRASLRAALQEAIHGNEQGGPAAAVTEAEVDAGLHHLARLALLIA